MKSWQMFIAISFLFWSNSNCCMNWIFFSKEGSGLLPPPLRFWEVKHASLLLFFFIACLGRNCSQTGLYSVYARRKRIYWEAGNILSNLETYLCRLTSFWVKNSLMQTICLDIMVTYYKIKYNKNTFITLYILKI